MKQTQREKILDFLQSGGKLTRLSALRDFGVIELPARICELKKEGYAIISKPKQIETTHNGLVTIAEYSMRCES